MLPTPASVRSISKSDQVVPPSCVESIESADLIEKPVRSSKKLSPPRWPKFRYWTRQVLPPLLVTRMSHKGVFSAKSSQPFVAQPCRGSTNVKLAMVAETRVSSVLIRRYVATASASLRVAPGCGPDCGADVMTVGSGERVAVGFAFDDPPPQETASPASITSATAARSRLRSEMIATIASASSHLDAESASAVSLAVALLLPLPLRLGLLDRHGHRRGRARVRLDLRHDRSRRALDELFLVVVDEVGRALLVLRVAV